MCSQGVTGVSVFVTAVASNGDISGTFRSFNLPGRHNARDGEFAYVGTYNVETRTFHIVPIGWLRMPPGYHVAGFTATVDGSNRHMSGSIDLRVCGAITLDWVSRQTNEMHLPASADVARAQQAMNLHNYKAAFYWLNDAASQGDANAKDGLGMMYEHGLGVAADVAAAARYYREAASQGQPFAADSLGAMYEQGRGGLPKDAEQAMKWYQLGAQHGSAEARNNAARLKAAEESAPVAAAATPAEQWVQCNDKRANVAIAGCTALIQANQEDAVKLATAYRRRGSAYDRRKEYDAAIRDFNQSSKLDPHDDAALFDRGMAYFHKGDITRALKDCSDVVERNAKDLEALYCVGTTRADLHQYGQAKAAFDQATATDRNFAKAYVGRGGLFAMQNKLDDAVRELNRAIEVDPRMIQPYYMLGEIYRTRGQLAQAIQYFDRALAIDPGNQDAIAGRNMAMAQGVGNVLSNLFAAGQSSGGGQYHTMGGGRTDDYSGSAEEYMDRTRYQAEQRMQGDQ